MKPRYYRVYFKKAKIKVMTISARSSEEAKIIAQAKCISFGEDYQVSTIKELTFEKFMEERG